LAHFERHIVPAKFRVPAGTVIPPGGFLVFDAAQLGFGFQAIGDAVWLFSAAPSSPPTGYIHGWEFGASNEDQSFGRFVNSMGEEHFVGQSQATLGSPNVGPVRPLAFINEIHYAPAAGGDEFIELRNTNSIPAFIGSARVVGLNYVLPADAQIAPGGFAVIVTSDPATFRAKYGVKPEVPIYGPASGSLQDNGENIALELPVTIDGVAGFLTLDRVRYNDRRPMAGFLPLDRERRFNAWRARSMAGRTFGNEPRNWQGASPSPGATNAVNCRLHASA
jgi:hypothetical protein